MLEASRRSSGERKVSFEVGEGWGVRYKPVALLAMASFGMGMRLGKVHGFMVMSPRWTRGRKRAKTGSEQSMLSTAPGWRSSSSQIQRREQGRFWV